MVYYGNTSQDVDLAFSTGDEAYPQSASSNPHKSETYLWYAWDNGWKAAARQHRLEDEGKVESAGSVI